MERARRYLATIPPAVSGMGGSNVTFHAACALVHGLALSACDGLSLLLEWNCGCKPQWSEAELRHKLEDAGKAAHRNPRGYLLEGDEPRVASVPTAGATPLPLPRDLPDRSGFGAGTPEQLSAWRE